ncbi:MAG: helix-turn-helix transcriptional regulator [Bacteriovoracales bacterium]|nr:helix-turn-helix transcriptional regulator [Bacteriovoracales bacterium]
MKGEGKIDIEFGKRLKKLRMKQKLSPEEVARASGVAVSTYREWENGRAITGCRPYFKLTMALGVSFYQLFGLEDGQKDKILLHLDAMTNLIQEVRNAL